MTPTQVRKALLAGRAIYKQDIADAVAEGHGMTPDQQILAVHHARTEIDLIDQALLILS